MKKIILLGSVVLVSACSSNKTVETLTNVPPESIVAKEVYEYKAQAVVDQIEVMPEWFLKPPTSETAIYSVGTAVTPDLQLTVDIAVLNAKTTLADRINGKVRSQTKSFIAKIGSEATDTSILSEVEKATKNIIADVDVAGYKVSESSVVANGTQYRAYVLLEYSDKEANKIIMNRLRKDRMLLSKIRSTKAWKELDESVDEQHKLDSEESLTNMEILTQ
jgi:hypothetical protein|tara:strand:+ start:273 stop:932 length:660 start_codon:yes stop_codon:yes gene_type:complete